MMASLPVPAWVLYAGLAYPALLYEVLTDQSYAQHATLTTVREDAVRVAVCLAGWASLFIGLRVVPRALLPAWLCKRQQRQNPATIPLPTRATTVRDCDPAARVRDPTAPAPPRSCPNHRCRRITTRGKNGVDTSAPSASTSS